MQTLRVKCLRTGAKPPHYASASAAGADLYACLLGPFHNGYSQRMLRSGLYRCCYCQQFARIHTACRHQSGHRRPAHGYSARLIQHHCIHLMGNL